jgi:hypothetical protein
MLPIVCLALQNEIVQYLKRKPERQRKEYNKGLDVSTKKFANHCIKVTFSVTSAQGSAKDKES